MKRFALMIAFATLGWSQNVTPFNNEKLNIQDQYGVVYTEGHWVETDGKGHAIPSVSVINCSRESRTCTEETATYNTLGGTTFSLDASHAEYQIERWTPTEIVASTIRGMCMMRHTLKILLKEGQILALDAPSEPIKPTGNAEADKMLNICRETTAFELKGGKVFWAYNPK